MDIDFKNQSKTSSNQIWQFTVPTGVSCQPIRGFCLAPEGKIVRSINPQDGYENEITVTTNRMGVTQSVGGDLHYQNNKWIFTPNMGDENNWLFSTSQFHNPELTCYF